MTAKGYTPSSLIEAIHAGQLSGVINALNDGADIEMADMHGYRGLPLRAACFEGNLAIIRELLNRGADVNAVASDGPNAPVRLALRKGHEDVATLLLQHGATMPTSFEAPTKSFASAEEPMLEPAEIPMLPDSKPESNIIEFTRAEAFLTPDEVDSPSQFGTETNVLSMDLLFLDEGDGHPLSPAPKNDKQ